MPPDLPLILFMRNIPACRDVPVMQIQRRQIQRIHPVIADPERWKPGKRRIPGVLIFNGENRGLWDQWESPDHRDVRENGGKQGPRGQEESPDHRDVRENGGKQGLRESRGLRGLRELQGRWGPEGSPERADRRDLQAIRRTVYLHRFRRRNG